MAGANSIFNYVASSGKNITLTVTITRYMSPHVPSLSCRVGGRVGRKVQGELQVGKYGQFETGSR